MPLNNTAKQEIPQHYVKTYGAVQNIVLVTTGSAVPVSVRTLVKEMEVNHFNKHINNKQVYTIFILKH